MDITGEHRIPAPRDAVWKALNDPVILQQCIPGCKALEKIGDNQFKGTVAAKVGPVSATFTGEVTLSDLDPPSGYTLSGKGQGGAAGFASGECKVALREDGAETVLTYTADAKIGGKLAQLGARLVDGTVKKMAGEFFTTFTKLVGGASAEAAAVAAAPAPEAAPLPSTPAAPAAPAATDQAPSGGVSPVVWAGGLIAIVAIVLWYFAAK